MKESLAPTAVATDSLPLCNQCLEPFSFEDWMQRAQDSDGAPCHLDCCDLNDEDVRYLIRRM